MAAVEVNGLAGEISDVLGRHVIRMNDSVDRRKDLLMRLSTAGCSVDLSGNDWMSAGEFASCEH